MIAIALAGLLALASAPTPSPLDAAVGGAAASLQGAEGGMDLAPLNHFLAGRLVERTVIWRNCLAGQVVPQAYDAQAQGIWIPTPPRVNIKC